MLSEEKPSDSKLKVNSNEPRTKCEHLQPPGLLWKCLTIGERTTCGKILAHAKAQVTSLREGIGIRLCIFKIGITSNPSVRFDWYLERGYTCMWVIAASDNIGLISMLEAALISEYGHHVGCKNKLNSGGEGALQRCSPIPPPFYAYVVGGRADQNRWVG